MSFVIALGDNFYTSGVASVTDVSWTYLYEDVYLIYDCLNIPWYPVLGSESSEHLVDSLISHIHAACRPRL